MRKQRGKTISQNRESVEIFCFVTVHIKCEGLTILSKRGFSTNLAKTLILNIGISDITKSRL